jgi:hypothetical protein
MKTALSLIVFGIVLTACGGSDPNDNKNPTNLDQPDVRATTGGLMIVPKQQPIPKASTGMTQPIQQ